MTRSPIDPARDPPSPASGHTLIDSHCHLDMEEFASDRTDVLARAAAAGVITMVTIGASGPLEANHAAIELAEAHDAVFATVGVHPHEASTVNDQVIGSIAQLASHPKVVAIGETGLDYHYKHSPPAQQQEAFRRFIHLARELRMPIVVHLRAAEEDAAQIMRDELAQEAGGVIHCFSGDACSARTFLDLGFHISFSGVVTFKNAARSREAAALVPADRLLIETDAPFLAPVPYRGQRNEPALVVHTAAVLAEVRGKSVGAVADSTRDNARRLFSLPTA